MSRWLYISVIAFSIARAEAVHVDVRVLDKSARPVSGIVVTMHGPSTGAPKATASTAIMDQIEQRFLPFVLPVRVGTPVRFPNSDSVAHQVYSFSQPKRFELGLYRGKPHAPVVFDKPGIVVLGCNIHDKMVGYIYVTDAAYFGKTSGQGAWRADGVANGEYRVEIWSPLLARDEPVLTRTITVADGREDELVFHLTRALQPEPRPQLDRKLRDY
jgi:plastocyanin